MHSRAATNNNFIVFGFTWPGLETTIYQTLGEQAKNYTTDAVGTKIILPNWRRLKFEMLAIQLKQSDGIPESTIHGHW